MGDQCHYEVHVKTAKEEMVRRIKSLEHQNAELQGSVKERDGQIEAILEALRTGERGSEVIARLRAGQSHRELVGWLGGPLVGDVDRLSPGSEISVPDVAQDYDDPSQTHVGSRSPDGDSRSRWTFANPQLTDHLIALFFTWVHPIHMLFSEYYFMRSFSDGDRDYCSPAMVNMMCAMGCHYHTDPSGDERQSRVLQKRFFERGIAEVAKEDPRSLTCVTTIHYHVTFCQLYRPILELAEIPETTRARLISITTQSALDGLQLLQRYRSLYTHRYQNPLLAFCIVHICETLLRAGRDQKRAVQFALEATHESLAGFTYVGPLQFMFCQTAEEECVSLPEDVRQLMGGRTSYGPEEMLDACERVTFTQPYQMLRHRVDRNLGVEFEREWKQAIPVEVHGAAGTSQWVGGGTGSRDAGLMAQRSESTSSSASGGSNARSMQINSVVNP
ncbi:hypothetical protein SLS55_003198 [Diplodia seriata]|uniref:Xylanolytic transcriptional activator regulatory domain-containing protein n=1 Tax=Diplodia seriata TaxID=420778 RepID=A0ABR3CMA9_9PEZI